MKKPLIENQTMLSLVIPCYNEAEVLPIFYTEVSHVLAKIQSEMQIAHELIFVDDGSRDETLSVIKKIAATDKCVRYISFSRNFGKEAAMLAGLRSAKGDFVCIMDADLQDPPSLLPQMLSKITSGKCDSVATRRFTRDGEPVLRSFFANQFYRVINKISDADIVSGARDFRLMSRKMTDAVLSLAEYNRFSKGIFGWVGFRTEWLPYKNIERAAGKTKWNFWKLLRYAIDGIINFSETPLAIASWFGIFMTLVGVAILIFIVVRKIIFGDPVAGWASTACIIVFSSGIQLFCTGIIGQYIAKIYMEAKHRPHYIVKESNTETE